MFPGRPRIKAVAAAQARGGTAADFYVFSGEATRTVNGKTHLDYLADAWRFDPRNDLWTEITAPPRAVAAAVAAQLPVRGARPTHALGRFARSPRSRMR